MSSKAAKIELIYLFVLDLMTYDGDDYELERITIQPENGNVYMPEEVLDILD